MTAALDAPPRRRRRTLLLAGLLFVAAVGAYAGWHWRQYLAQEARLRYDPDTAPHRDRILLFPDRPVPDPGQRPRGRRGHRPGRLHGDAQPRPLDRRRADGCEPRSP